MKKVPLEQVKEIFFEASSVKEFSCEKDKESFFYRWCGQYLEKYPSHFLIAIDSRNEEAILGYSCSHPDSLKAIEELEIPGQDLFKDLYSEYPLQLHINCHASARGRGVGRSLIEHQSRLSSKGIHIITSKDADNYGFYKALGFDREEEADFKGHILLFMGKKTG